jgi:CRP-like cAMP-binding protein
VARFDASIMTGRRTPHGGKLVRQRTKVMVGSSVACSQVSSTKKWGLGERCDPGTIASEGVVSSRKGGARKLNNKTNSTRGKRLPGLSKRTDPRGTPVENLILSQIPDPEYHQIRPHLEFTETQGYQKLHEPGERLDYAYFPNRGMIAVVVEISDSRTLEVGVITKKGFAGESLTADQHTCPYRLICQPAVDGFQVKAEALRKILRSTPDLRRRLNRYVRFQSLRTAQIAACNRFHEIGQRLARWLLMSQDRVSSIVLPFTHDFLASMLGTGRASISIAAGTLQKVGLIEYRRGAVRVINREGLEEAACECYGIIKHYEAASEQELS